MANIFGMESRWVNREPAAAQPLHLTPRQLDVLSLLCEGLSNKLIGRRLNISAATVKIHIACILRTLSVNSRLQAVIAAHRWGLVDAANQPVASARPVAAPERGLDSMATRFLRSVTGGAPIAELA